MDNVRFHHAPNNFYDSYPYNINFLPRYSRLLNPCEETFSLLKSSVRRSTAAIGTDELIERMRFATANIDQISLSHFFHHSEQFFERCLNREDIER
ncbi:hypothetical protein GVAV_000719 [Gurleya vavrai]